MKKFKSNPIPIVMLVIAALALVPACTDKTPAPVDNQTLSLTQNHQAPVNTLKKVELEVWKEFKAKSKQIVLVTIQDDLAVHSRPACKMGNCPVRTDPQTRLLRMADLANTKSGILKKLAKATERGAATRVKHLYPHFSVMALEVNREAVSALADLPEVNGVFLDRKVRMNISSSVPFTGADEFHSGGDTGDGTAVAVLDTPVRYWNGYFGTCPDAGAPNCKVKVWENFAPTDPMDVANNIAHGTNVAGIVLGMAPNTDILSLNVFYYDTDEGGYIAVWSDLTAALEWTAANQAQYNIVSTNMSLGGTFRDSRPCNESPLYDPIRTLWVDHGVLNAIATGNDEQFDWVSEPGCISLALSVGAQFDTQLSTYWGSCTHSNPHTGEIVCFSNLNGFMDLLAPGVYVTAGGQSNYSGTSMATPHVAGAVALLQSYWYDILDFQSPYWAHKEMKVRALAHHHGGRVFSEMEVTDWDAPDFNLAWKFDNYFKEMPEGLLPFSPSTYTKQITVTGEGWNIGGAYLYLEVIHPYPDNVEVTLEAPDGSSASTFLPGGGANFNAVLGRDYYPALFEDLAGSPVDGTWTLTLEDTQNTFFGYYLDAALFWTASNCVPDCPGGSACGDDLCGGSCGTCTGTAECMPDRTCDSCSPSCSGQNCGDDGCGGSCGNCDDGVFCNGAEGCVDGSCTDTDNPCGDPADYPCRTCDEVNQDCIQAAGTCFIEWECFDDDDAHPDDTCLVCDSSVSINDWSTIDCDDGDPCTDDSCDQAAGCVHTNNSASCDDGDACTTGDTCSAGSCVGTTLDCDDGNVCTDDSCDSATGCEYANNDLTCDDADACTSDDACVAGSCLGTAKVCEDSDVCTDDGCNAGTGECEFTPNTATCDDGDICTESDTCAAGVCAGTALDCDDGDVCTDDSCDAVNGCVHSDNAAACDDADLCTENDTCAAGVCAGTAVVCDDADPCTDDACDPVTGDCVTSPNTGACDDGDACTENDTCADGVCAGTAMTCDDDDPCTDDTCDPATGCVFTPNDTTDCDDGNPCTENDACVAGACTGTEIDCSAQDDGCNQGVCDTDTGECVTEPLADGTACDDGDACTNGETCQNGSCTGGEDTCEDDGGSGGCNCGLADGSRRSGSLLLLLLGLCGVLTRRRIR